MNYIGFNQSSYQGLVNPALAAFYANSPSGSQIAATGGTTQEIGGYRIHSFLSGTTNFTVTQPGYAEVLVIGGGGAGGGAGGGGGGGFLYYPSKKIDVGTYSAVVANTATASGQNATASGNNTTFLGLTAFGGGGGANYSAGAGPNNGLGGASGGGGGFNGSGELAAGGSQINDQGHVGGFGCNGWVQYVSGGGGGAGGAGYDARGSNSGSGGPGRFCDILGPGYWWAAGGGGGSQSSGLVSGLGGLGGGGGGGQWSGSSGQAGGPGGLNVGGTGTEGVGGNAGANTGSGGGGQGISVTTSGTGGSGIVVVRYKLSSYSEPLATTVGHPTMSGGSQWFSSGYLGIETDSRYKLTNGATYSSVTHRRRSTTQYAWWVMFSKYVGGIVYPSFGCRIYVPAGGTVGDVITTPFINSLGHFGVPRVPLLENWYISWHSNDPNFYDGVAAPIFVDYDQNQVPLGSGTVYWTPSGVAPHQGNAWTPTSLAGSNGIHIAVS